MKLLVTGGAGFIGSNFIKYMLIKYPDYDIVCLDKLTYAGHLSTIAESRKNPNFKFIKGDITNEIFINNLFENESFDAVVNFAAESHVDRSIDNPQLFIVTNIIGTQILMDACRNNGNVRFHQVSTDEVYGDLPINCPHLCFTEDSPLRAANPYSSSKAGADLLVQAYYRTYGLPITISRCSNNYGSYQNIEKFIPLIIVRASVDQKVPIYGDGTNVRDWLYVDDHCKAIDLILHKGKIGEIYNIGGCGEMDNNQTAKAILALLNKNENLIEYVADRLGHDKRYAIDSSKLHNELGWSPATKFKEGIEETVLWYLNNKNWWKNLRG